ncbi:solute carrier family 28 member 3 isoform X2 [Episyrphus balteatus]|uniref:solute carrier family 28 member 3 isoform X2 n=1 Tax=Episyrphus balteatus TaxID=286459 RepID=UPI0024862B8D|nr:solute carrier family 28 member 3 isoform X2 [Episyrphus balteatus]
MKGNLNEAYDDESLHADSRIENGYIDQEFPRKKDFKYKKELKICLQSSIHIAVGCFFAYATYYYTVVVQNRSYNDIGLYPNDTRCYVRCDMQFCTGYGLLVLLTGFIYAGLVYYYILKPKIGRKIHMSALKPLEEWWLQFSRTTVISALMIAIIFVALAVYLFFETRDSPEKLIGLAAPVFFILTGYVFSTSRKDIPWRTVITGILCQFVLGLVCIRWEVGRKIFECLGNKVATFLKYSEEGSRFVYGERIINDSVFAFATLPVIFFFSFFISILYYLGTMQWIVLKLGWILQEILGTTVCESVNSAANIFLGMSESPLLIRPYIKLLTASEMHSIMVSGFATVSGTVLAAYMSFGASPAHLITSSVMAAPATLAFSKLYLPETEESKTKSSNMQLQKSEDSSLLDAASNGASQAIPIIMGIIANIVAFVAFVSFLNGVVNWLGYLVGLNDIDFEWIFSKIFIPLAWAMGIPWKDCDLIAKVIASKTIINEFVAYERLGVYIDNEQIEPRSAGIATFAICGFANPSSLGILMGSLGVMAPTRRTLITSVAIRAFIVGSIVCFISASFAGLLIPEEETARAYQRFFEAKALARNHTMIAGILPL